MKYQSIVKSLAIGMLLWMMTASGAWAQQKKHKVQKGETLFGIAKKYNISVRQLKTWNDVSGRNLSVGQSLVVSKGGDRNAVKHTVKSGETLFSIAKQYHVSMNDIKSWNNLSSTQVEKGQKLTIYPSGGGSSSNEAKSESRSQQASHQSTKSEKKSEQNTYYTVKNGETLFKIGQKLNMSVKELKQLNDLSSNNIRVGQRLTVHADKAETPPSIASEIKSSPQGKFASYRVKRSSTSVKKLLRRFEMDETTFRALNPDKNTNSLRVGESVTVLVPPTKHFKNPYAGSGSMESLGTTRVNKYSSSEKAKPTTNGELYNPRALTAAHSSISLGSVVFIKNKNNGRGVFVRINDRDSGGGMKLSQAAWKALDFSGTNPTVSISQPK